MKKITVIAGVKDLTDERVAELKDMNVVVKSFTVDDPETLTALKTVHKLILIPPSSENRVEITLKVIDAAKKYKIKRITLVSVLGGNISLCGIGNTLKLHLGQLDIPSNIILSSNTSKKRDFPTLSSGVHLLWKRIYYGNLKFKKDYYRCLQRIFVGLLSVRQM